MCVATVEEIKGEASWSLSIVAKRWSCIGIEKVILVVLNLGFIERQSSKALCSDWRQSIGIKRSINCYFKVTNDRRIERTGNAAESNPTDRRKNSRKSTHDQAIDTMTKL